MTVSARNLVSMALARGAARVAKGWSQAEVRKAAELAVGELRALVAPFAFDILAEHRRAGRKLVLATTTPEDMVAAFAESMGFDDIIATRYQVAERPLHRSDHRSLRLGTGKLAAVRRWPRGGHRPGGLSRILRQLLRLPLLSSVGTPHAVNPDPRLLGRGDRPPLADRALGPPERGAVRARARAPGRAPARGAAEAFPYARFEIEGLEIVPESGPVLLAANHRAISTSWPWRWSPLGWDARSLSRQEGAFRARPARLGGACNRRDPRRPGQRVGPALREAEAALRAGEIVVVYPGHHPARSRFFDPVLHGQDRHGAHRRGDGATVVPIGIWGTEHVWPRSARVPTCSTSCTRPTCGSLSGRRSSSVMSTQSPTRRC